MKEGKAKVVRNEEGQSTVEFVLTMIFLMAFVLFYVQLAFSMAFANYVHYATFMAARAYLSSGQDEGEQRARAQDVLVGMVKKNGAPGLDRFPSVAKGQDSSDSGGSGNAAKGMEIISLDPAADGNPDSSWQQGVRYTFMSRFFALPGMGGTAKDRSVKLTSESWLGREPTVSECLQDLGKMHGIYDNGC